MKILIKVTKEILNRSAMCSKHNNSENCAIALAVRDIFPDACVVHKEVYPTYRSPNPSSLDDFNLPEEARDFILEFDASTPEERKQMKPISFVVDVPDSLIGKIGIAQVEEILSKSETLEKV